MALRPCFKACNKHTESRAIFLGIKIPICTNPGYVCSYFVFSYNMRSKTGKKERCPYQGNAYSLCRDYFCILRN